MLDTLIRVGIVIGIVAISSVFVFFPLASFISCGIRRSFKEVWIDEQKHNIRVIRRLFVNDLTECPACGSISLEYNKGFQYYCLKCSYTRRDEENL